MASTEDLQLWADTWLAELEDGERQMQEILRVMSSPSNHPLQGQGGESLMADWMEDKIQQLLEIIWAFEEGPDPGLDDFIDWERERGIVCRCYDLLREGQALSDSYCVNDSEGDTTTSTISTVKTGENVSDSVVNDDKIVEPVSVNIGSDNNMIGDDTTAGSEEEGDSCVDNNNDNNDINDNTYINKINRVNTSNNNNNNNNNNNINRSDSCNNNNDNIDNNNNNNNNNNHFKNSIYRVLGAKGIDNNNGAVGMGGDADNNSTDNIDNNDYDGYGWDDMDDMRIDCGCRGMIRVVGWQRMGVG
ncbi:hypothetical protein CBR_g52217 [Chara braunii]|uniref:Uncharacterized protein n=1 Tax=Chara braunii TaxID=69332 RepID=A0A388M9S7_CHABU|nr:hypothetical protein CBR_g52217 [Chara braunii]|eukprot:GBG91331.1 hypothetical protein CBR_g52217 [Chara braunii]